MPKGRKEGTTMAVKTNCTINGIDYFKIRRKIGRRLNKSGEWVDHYKTFYGKSKKEAEAKFDEYMRKSEMALVSNKCLAELIDEWISSTFKNSNLAEGTQKLYTDVYRKYFRPSDLAARQPEEVTAADIQHWFNTIEIKSYHQKKKLLTFLKKFYAFAEINRIVSVNITGIEIRRPDLDYMKALMPFETWPMDDVKWIIELGSGTYLRFLVVMAVNTGLRISELLALDYEDIHGGYVHVTKQVQCDNGSLHLQKPKSETSIRKVPLSAYVMNELEIHRQMHLREMNKRGYITHHIFSSTVGGYLDRHNVTKALNKLYKDNDIQYHKFHCYRHTYGTNLDRLGYSLIEIKELMGHSSIETTKKYVHASGDRLTESAEKLSALCM